MQTAQRIHLSPHDRVRVAAAAVCDPRCVVRWLRGMPLRSTTRARIETAVVALGLVAARSDASKASES
ncbi:MAG: hypothetical protein ACLP1X_10185 [Polyangiaceae bacterium]